MISELDSYEEEEGRGPQLNIRLSTAVTSNILRKFTFRLLTLSKYYLDCPDHSLSPSSTSIIFGRKMVPSEAGISLREGCPTIRGLPGKIDGYFPLRRLNPQKKRKYGKQKTSVWWLSFSAKAVTTSIRPKFLSPNCTNCLIKRKEWIQEHVEEHCKHNSQRTDSFFEGLMQGDNQGFGGIPKD